MQTQWNSEILPQIESLLNANQTALDGKAIAVFDADGTLWPDDLGEAFFKHQIHYQLAPGIKGMKQPWDYYAGLDRLSTADANAWIVKLNAGLKLQEIRSQAKKFYEQNFKKKLNPVMAELIVRLQEKHFDIWICSASMKWAIEPALYDLNIPLERLIGTESEVDSSGRLTQTIKTPIPYADGKKRALELYLPHAPELVCGNSLGDLEMLKWASKLPLVVQYFPAYPGVAGSEMALRQEVQNRGWPLQIFNVTSKG